jgi:hypothetical protein
MRDDPASLFAYASPTSLTLEPVRDVRDLYWSYLESGIARTAPGSSIRTGFFSRLFESLVGAGAYERALRIWNENGFDIPRELPDFRTFAAFLDALPSGAASIVFSRAICALNFEKKPQQASEWFGRTVEICKAKMKLAPRASAIESALFWNALFHQALAAVMAGDVDLGRRLAKEILEPSGTHGLPAEIVGRPNDNIRERAERLLR